MRGNDGARPSTIVASSLNGAATATSTSWPASARALSSMYGYPAKRRPSGWTISTRTAASGLSGAVDGVEVAAGAAVVGRLAQDLGQVLARGRMIAALEAQASEVEAGAATERGVGLERVDDLRERPLG